MKVFIFNEGYGISSGRCRREGSYGNERGRVSLSGPCGPRVTTQYQMLDILDGPGLSLGDYLPISYRGAVKGAVLELGEAKGWIIFLILAC